VSDDTKIDTSAEYLKGRYYEMNSEGTELAFPPIETHVISTNAIKEKSDVAKYDAGCGGKVRLTRSGSGNEVHFYLKNHSDKNATVTLELSWTYQNRRYSQTAQHNLYPGQNKLVFGFALKQNPGCSIIACSLAE